MTLSILATASLLAAAASASYIQYSTVPGYFLQDLNSTNQTTFDYTQVNFGLINQTYPTDCAGPSTLTQWQRFARVVFELNLEAPSNVEYKVLYMGRHGEGWHNAAQTYYGTPAWNCYYAEIDGNATAVWSDAHLDGPGIAQAQVANNFWRMEIAEQKIPVPQSYYVSPLTRCLQTANVTFYDLDLPSAYPFVPTVKEFLREGISIHTCDRRSNRTFIAEHFPTYNIEASLTEEDELWNGVTAETNSAQDVRSQTLLDEIFTSDGNTYLSFTSHSGELGSVLRVIGHIPFSLNTGEVIPALVKAETFASAPTTTTSSQPWTISPHCTSPPVTSIDNNGPCVCQASATPVTFTLSGAATTYSQMPLGTPVK